MSNPDTFKELRGDIGFGDLDDHDLSIHPETDPEDDLRLQLEELCWDPDKIHELLMGMDTCGTSEVSELDKHDLKRLGVFL